MPFLISLRTYCTQVAGNLVCEHFLQTQTEQVWRVAAIGSCYHIASRTCCPTRPAMTRSATIAETCSEAEIGVDITQAVVCNRAMSLTTQKLPLEELATAPNGTKWIASDNKRRRIRCSPISCAGTNLLCERFGNSEICSVWVLCAVIQLR